MRERAAKVKVEEDEEIELQRKSEFEKKNHIVQNLTLPQFGALSMVENPLVWEKPVYMKMYNFERRTDMRQQLAWAVKRRQVDSRHLNTYHDYTSDWHSSFCSSSGWIRHFFEIPTLLLSQFLQSHSEHVRTHNIFLTELLYQICTAGSELEAKGLFHGNITPEYIRVREQCSFQLVDNFGSLDSLDACTSDILLGLRKHSSPEMMESVFQKTTLSKIEASKHDVFCFGLLLLALGLGCPLDEVYRSDGRLNRVVLNAYLKQLNDKYESNSLFGTTVSSMLETKVAFRPDFRGIISKLPPHSEVRRHFIKEYQLPADLNLSFEEIGALQPSRKTHNKLLQEQSANDSRENTSMYYGRLHGPEDVGKIQQSLSKLVQGKEYNLEMPVAENKKYSGINDSVYVRELKRDFYDKSKQKMIDRIDDGNLPGTDINQGIFNILAGLNVKESQIIDQTDFRAPAPQPTQSSLSKSTRGPEPNPTKKNVQFEQTAANANISSLFQQMNMGNLFASPTTAAPTMLREAPQSQYPARNLRPQAVYTGLPTAPAQTGPTAFGTQYFTGGGDSRREYVQGGHTRQPQQAGYSYGGQAMAPGR